jgi:signal transduction histidine kinase
MLTQLRSLLRFRAPLSPTFVIFRWVTGIYLIMLGISLLVLPPGNLGVRLSPVWAYAGGVFIAGLVYLWVNVLRLPRRSKILLSIPIALPLIFSTLVYVELGLIAPASILSLLALGIVWSALAPPVDDTRYHPDYLAIAFGIAQVMVGLDYSTRLGVSAVFPAAAGISENTVGIVFMLAGAGVVLTQLIAVTPDALRRLVHAIAGLSLVGLLILQSIYIDTLYWILGAATLIRGLTTALIPWISPWLHRFDNYALHPRLALGLVTAAIAPTVVAITVLLSLIGEDMIGRSISRPLLFGATLLFALLAGIAAWWAAGQLAAPLSALVQSVRKVPQGDFLAELPKSGISEIVNLKSAIQTMAATIEAQTAERDLLYEAERQARRRAEEADALKLKFLAMISHELRTPLASIKGFATTLLAEDVAFTAEQQRQFIRVIDLESDKLTGLVEQLLDLSRLQAGTLRIERTPQAITDVLERAMTDLRTLAAQHKLNINLSDALPLVSVDGERIAQVITNLVGNAAKFSPVGSGITIVASPTATAIQIDVSDEGIGIPHEERDKVFEAFQQSERKNANQRQGAGLGLAICKSIIEAHNGRIWIRDQPRGTTISFTLPTSEPLDSLVLAQIESKAQALDFKSSLRNAEQAG